MDKENSGEIPAPLWAALLKYRDENNLRLHMPGHLGGRGLPEAYRDLAQIDLTEVPGIDDLHQPRSHIEQARRLMAQAYGARESFFLVNGATSGMHALFMSLPGSKSRVLIPRSFHRSVWGGLVLSGATPIYVASSHDAELGIPLAIDPQCIEDKLKADSGIKAVFLTSPSYFGTSLNISDIFDKTCPSGVALLVDEAHGAHFAFHPSYPRPALAQGADAVVNGLHKTLPVLNQGACLHIGRQFKYRDRLAKALSLLTTTSPSFPLLASMDKARQYMQKQGRDCMERAMQIAMQYRSRIEQIPGLNIWNPVLENNHHTAGQDPLKLTVRVSGLCLNGLQLADLLRREHHIQAELAQPLVVMFMMSIFHREDEWERLFQALAKIAGQYAAQTKKSEKIPLPPIPQVVLSPRQAFWYKLRRVKLKDSLGHLGGEMVAPYPPGIPCILPGELIDTEILNYLWYIKQRGLSTHGPHDPALNYIMVLDEPGKGRK